MEISAGYYVALLGKHDRIIGDTVDFDAQGVAHVIERISGCPMDLRHASKAVRVLNSRTSQVRDPDFTVSHEGKEVRCDGLLTGVGAQRLDARFKGDRGPL